MLALTRGSAAIRRAQNDLIAGRLTYKQLAIKILLRSPRILYEVATRPDG
jgi:hypothetical protein